MSNYTNIENSVTETNINETKTTERPNDRFLKDFYNESVSKGGESESIPTKHERKNITYFIHKLLNKRDNSYKSKIAHFKNQTNSAEPKRTGKEFQIKVNKNLSRDSNINEIVENISRLQQKELDNSQYRKRLSESKGIYSGLRIKKDTYVVQKEHHNRTEEGPRQFHNQIREKILTNDDNVALENQRTSLNIHSLMDKNLFQTLKSSLLENEEFKNKTAGGKNTFETLNKEIMLDVDKEAVGGITTHDKNIDNNQTMDNDKTNYDKNNTSKTMLYNMTNNCMTKLDNETDCNPTTLNSNWDKTNGKMNEDGNTGKIYNPGKQTTLTDIKLTSPCTTDNLTNSLRQLVNNIDTEHEYDCETAKDFVKENCDEAVSDTIQQKEDQHLQAISQFFQFHHNNQTVGIRNATAEECCHGNHILDILKMLNRILPSERRFPFFQSRQLKTHKESWLFRINKQQVVLTNSEISRIIRKGFESYHNHIDGFELFECKIFGRCLEEVNNTEKNQERKKTRKEKRQQQKKRKQFRNQNP